MFESLERRRMFAVSLSPKGVLEITGTPVSDVMTLNTATPGVISVTLNGQEFSFARSGVVKVVFDCKNGNDRVDLHNTDVTLPVEILGGAGKEDMAGIFEVSPVRISGVEFLLMP